MGIISSIGNKISGAVNDVKERAAKKAEEARKANEAKKASEAAKNQESSEAKESDGSLLSKGAEKVMGFMESAKNKIAEKVTGSKLYEYDTDTRLMAKQMVKEGVCTEDELIILQCSDDGSNVSVTPGEEGSLVVNIDGEETILSAEEAERLIISGGRGNDNIKIDESIRAGLHIAGNDGDDNIVGGTGRDTIVGGRGNDNIDGGKGSDYIDGGAGNDNISGGIGYDVLIGGKGDDVIDGGDGNDKIYGDIDPSINTNVFTALKNNIFTGEGNDTISGGNGNDYIEGNGGNDVIEGNAGMDTIYGGKGSDEIRGGRDNDFINGGKGDDILYGEEGDDVLFGVAGNDSLYGGEGNDVIAGGKGNDTVDGGEGTNTITAGVSEKHADTITANDGDNIQYLDPKNTPLGIRVSSFGAREAYYDENGDKQYRTGIASAGFTDRVSDDLEAMSSLEYGQKLFGDIAASGHGVTIKQLDEENGFCSSLNERESIRRDDGTSGSGSSSTISYNPSLTNVYNNYSWSQTPAMLILGHEFNHAYNNAMGDKDTRMITETSDKNSSSASDIKACERQAVGLDVDGVKQNPVYATENGWRRYFNIHTRDSYSGFESSTAALKQEETEE